MDLTKSAFIAIVQRFLEGKASDEEKAFLDAYYQYFEQETDGLEGLTVEEKVLLEAAMRDRILAEVYRAAPVSAVRLMWRWIAAAVVLGVLCTAAYYLYPRSKPVQPVLASMDVAPATNGAILTLSDGKQMVLDSLGNGIVATQNGVHVMLENGQLFYDQEEETGDVTTYNTMTTPKGRRFHIKLPDGTKVWLNAASSIRYPTQFTGEYRTVEVSGEVYFEVVQNVGMPFRVNVNGQMGVEVLGTSFNINAYNNEPSLETTLLKGMVRVRYGAATALLRPGQQAQVNTGTKEIPVYAVDMEKVMSWRSGFFNFENEDLKTVMREIERWYDIEVVFEKNVPEMRFGGGISRDVNLAGVLSILEGADVHFRMEEGRRLIVMP